PPPDLRRCSDSDESQTTSPGSQSFKSRIYRGRQGVQAIFSGRTEKFITPDTWANRRGPAAGTDEPHVVKGPAPSAAGSRPTGSPAAARPPGGTAGTRSSRS